MHSSQTEYHSRTLLLYRGTDGMRNSDASAPKSLRTTSFTLFVVACPWPLERGWWALYFSDRTGDRRRPRNTLAPQVAGEIHEVTADDLF
jgi:hypothetical protein